LKIRQKQHVTYVAVRQLNGMECEHNIVASSLQHAASPRRQSFFFQVRIVGRSSMPELHDSCSHSAKPRRSQLPYQHQSTTAQAERHSNFVETVSEKDSILNERMGLVMSLTDISDSAREELRSIDDTMVCTSRSLAPLVRSSWRNLRCITADVLPVVCLDGLRSSTLPVPDSKTAVRSRERRMTNSTMTARPSWWLFHVAPSIKSLLLALGVLQIPAEDLSTNTPMTSYVVYQTISRRPTLNSSQEQIY